VAGGSARCRLGHGLQQTVGLTAAWPGAPEQGILQHACHAARAGCAGWCACPCAGSLASRADCGLIGQRSFGVLAQQLVGAFTVQHLLIDPGHQRLLHQRLALRRRDRAELAARWQHVGARGLVRPALGVEQAHQRLAQRQFGDGSLDVEPGLGAHGLRRGAHRFLVARGESAQRVLDAVAQLAQHRIGDVERVLRDEIHPHALGAHQPHHQLDALDQHLGRVFEQQVRLVKKEHQLGLFGVADLGQLLEQLGQHPEQKGGVEAWRVQQPIGGQNVDHALPAHGLHEVVQVEHGLAKELLAALALDLQQTALDRANAGGADVAVFGGVLARVVAQVLQHGAQVFEVEQQQALVVSDFEHQVEHAGLGVVEVEHARQQQRPHVRHGGAHRVPLLAKHIPERGRASQRLGRSQVAISQHLRQLGADLAALADAAQVALDVGHEHRHPQARETLGHGLQGHGFAGAGGPGDEAVAVRQPGQQLAFGGGVARDQQRFGHGLGLPKLNSRSVRAGPRGQWWAALTRWAGLDKQTLSLYQNNHLL